MIQPDGSSSCPMKIQRVFFFEALKLRIKTQHEKLEKPTNIEKSWKKNIENNKKHVFFHDKSTRNPPGGLDIDPGGAFGRAAACGGAGEWTEL